MRKRQALLALAILSLTSTLCIKGMQAVGRRIEEAQEREKKWK